jgi:hypothetical protein
MIDRRKLKRYKLNIPTLIEIGNKNNHVLFDTSTSDISAVGAFFHTKNALPLGNRVKLTFKLHSNKLKELTGAQGFVKIKGRVVRSDHTGMAIHFDKQYQLMGLRKL